MTESEDVLASYHAADYALVNLCGAEVGESIRSPNSVRSGHAAVDQLGSVGAAV
jgi:hypothetical protein